MSQPWTSVNSSYDDIDTEGLAMDDSTTIRRCLRRAADMFGATVTNRFPIHSNGPATIRRHPTGPDSSAVNQATNTPDAPEFDITAYDFGPGTARAVDLMRSPAPTVTVGATPDEAIFTLLSTHGPTVAVVDTDGYLVDLMTEDSLARGYLTRQWVEAIGIAQIARPAASMTVPDFTHARHTVGLDTSLPEIVATMLQFGLHALPVVHYGRPVGIVSWYDIATGATEDRSASLCARPAISGTT